MMKLLLLVLVLGLAHADEMSGVWFTAAIAADNVDTIQEGGPLRLYMRELQCQAECQQLKVTFEVQGDNHYKAVRQTEKFITFYNENVDSAGRKTKMIYVLGKEDLDAAEIKRLEHYATSEQIPIENIEYVHRTDTCAR
uniref:Lipocalin/cytosolic fatty-acid binding domain-containing protein n=1 Tax=Nannospalax galili TaxID=1026970 RepID=A0A8C6QTJ3_NANGA